jgi:hypothetical protein
VPSGELANDVGGGCQVDRVLAESMFAGAGLAELEDVSVCVLGGSGE